MSSPNYDLFSMQFRVLHLPTGWVSDYILYSQTETPSVRTLLARCGYWNLSELFNIAFSNQYKFSPVGTFHYNLITHHLDEFEILHE